MVYDAGAYTKSSWHMTAGLVITGPYRWPAFDVVGLGVQTNRFAAGNYRAPTGPQLTHALNRSWTSSPSGWRSIRSSSAWRTS